MKWILLLLTLSMGACLKKEGTASSYRVPEESLQLILFDRGREVDRKVLALDADGETRVKMWMESFDGLTKDYDSYAPAMLLLGQKVKVNFMEGATIISLKEGPDPDAVWKQYSRSPTQLDKEIRALLEGKAKSS